MPEQYQNPAHPLVSLAQRPCSSENRSSGHATYRQLLFTFLIVTSSVAFAKQSDEVCQCRAPGGMMQDLGSVACFDIVGNNRMMRCEMSTNTPYWKELEGVEGCPDA